MREITKPFNIEDLLLKPDIVGRIKLSEDMQQTLAALCCYDGSLRRLLRCSKAGVLHTSSPRIDGIIHVKRTNGNYEWQGSDIPISEVMILGHPANNQLIWVKNDEIASATNGWPLAANAVLNITLDNLLNLHLLIVADGETAIIAYTR